jgi:hypothetical protein
MPGIDDPIEAVKRQYRDQPDPILDLILDVAGKVDFFAGVVSAIRKHFSKQAASERLAALLSAMECTIRRQEARVQQVSAKLESPEFVEALCTAVIQTLRTSDVEKIQRFASVLGNFAISSDLDWDRAAAFVRDVSEISKDDIIVLTILYRVFGNMMTSSHEDYRRDPFPQQFVERKKALYDAAKAQGYSDEDFVSSCERLRGLGLACLVVVYNQGDGFPMLLNQLHNVSECFRPTKRGMELVSLLGVR